MNVKNFFQSNSISLPKQNLCSDNFSKFISKSYNNCRKNLENLNDKCHVSYELKSALNDCDGVFRETMAAINHCLAGQPALAYRSIDKLCSNYPAPFSTLESETIPPKTIGDLYRIADLSERSNNLESIFHCPLEMRRHIPNLRYGVLGLPCLYLGGSLKLCKLECKITNAELANMHMSRFYINRRIKFLDFGYRPYAIAPYADILSQQAAGSNPNLLNFLKSYITYWPLIMASSIITKYDKVPFHEEYITPNLITQWIARNTQCDGVRYFSTRVSPKSTEIHSTLNYVFPANGNIQTGYCPKLKEIFKLTQPIKWQSSNSTKICSQDYWNNEESLKNEQLRKIN